MYHIGSEPDRSWVCLACHPEVKAALRGPEGAGLPVEHLADVRCPACEMMMTDWADKLGLPTPMLVCAFCDPKTQAAYRHQAFQLGEGRP